MIKIVTVFNSLNPGSLLQAISLYEVLTEKYSGVYFLDLKIRNPYLSGIKLSIKHMLKFRITDSIRQLRMPFLYKSILTKYSITTKSNEKDIFVLGSDEIWNVSRKDMLEHKKLWGIGLDLNNCISYAPSINNSTVNDIEKNTFVSVALNKMFSISVRDSYSKEVLNEIVDRDISLVCDPTMLLGIDKLKKMQESNPYEQYIFVYGPERCFSQEAINQIKCFAKEQNKKLISYYFYHSWCDKVLYGSPMEFLGLVSGADYVFTSTFHGTIFSIMYNKKFVVFGDKNNKVQEILNLFNLNVKYSIDKQLSSILFGEYNYERINNLIFEYQQYSKDYLFQSIEKRLYTVNSEEN